MNTVAAAVTRVIEDAVVVAVVIVVAIAVGSPKGDQVLSLRSKRDSACKQVKLIKT